MTKIFNKFSGIQIKLNRPKLKQSVVKAGKALWISFPILLGVILLVSLISAMIPASTYSLLFKNNYLIDSFVGSSLGSILAGNPITSYIIGGELLKQGVSLLAITAFIVAWVTVGLVQFPAESMLLGKKFAILRNVTSFIFSIIVAVVTVVMVGLI